MTEHVRRYATGALGIVAPVSLALTTANGGQRETVADLAALLYKAALAGQLALSDGYGCHALLRSAQPDVTSEAQASAHRLATDLLQRRARSMDRVVASIEAALAMAEDVAEGATDADLHAVLAQISDRLAGALSLIAD